MRLHGLLSFPLTPFTADDKVDLDVLAEHVADRSRRARGAVRRLRHRRVHGAPPGRVPRRWCATAVREVAGRVPVFAGAGGGPRHGPRIRRCGRRGRGGRAAAAPAVPGHLARRRAGAARRLRRRRHAAAPGRLPARQRGARPGRRGRAARPAHRGRHQGRPRRRGRDAAAGHRGPDQRRTRAPRSSASSTGCRPPSCRLQAYRAIGVASYSSAVLCFAPDIATAFYKRSIEDGDDDHPRPCWPSSTCRSSRCATRSPGYAVALVKAGAKLRGLAMGSVRPPLVDAYPEHVEQLAAHHRGRGRAALRAGPHASWCTEAAA